MNKMPYIGQRVLLNDHGMETIRGVTSHEMYQQCLNMRITGMTPDLVPQQVWGIDVDAPLVNQFLISNLDVDEIGNTFDA